MTLITYALSVITCCQVHIVEMPAPYAGYYDIKTQEIYLNADLPRYEWRRTVMHEAAHHLLRDLKDDRLRGEPYISEYAKTDYHENIAEEYADMMMNAGRPQNRKQRIIAQYLKTIE